MGSIGLLVFAIVAWQFLTAQAAWVVLIESTFAWLIVSVALWRLSQSDTRKFGLSSKLRVVPGIKFVTTALFDSELKINELSFVRIRPMYPDKPQLAAPVFLLWRA